MILRWSVVEGVWNWHERIWTNQKFIILCFTVDNVLQYHFYFCNRLPGGSPYFVYREVTKCNKWNLFNHLIASTPRMALSSTQPEKIFPPLLGAQLFNCLPSPQSESDSVLKVPTVSCDWWHTGMYNIQRRPPSQEIRRHGERMMGLECRSQRNYSPVWIMEWLTPDISLSLLSEFTVANYNFHRNSYYYHHRDYYCHLVAIAHLLLGLTGIGDR